MKKLVLLSSDPSYPRPPFGTDYRRTKKSPAWLESLLRHCRSDEPSARHRQMDTTEATLLYLETMGSSRLSGTAQTRCLRARSLEHQQKCAWSVAFIKDPCVIAGSAGEGICTNGAARLGGAAGMNHRTAVYVIRMLGGVGGRSREATSYPD